MKSSYVGGKSLIPVVYGIDEFGYSSIHTDHHNHTHNIISAVCAVNVHA